MVDASLMVDAAVLPARRSVASLSGTNKSEDSETPSQQTVTRTRRKVPEPGNRISSVSTSSSAEKTDKRTSAGSWEAAVASAVEAAGVSATESLSESVFRAVEGKGVTVTSPDVRGASIPSFAMPGSPIKAVPLPVMPEPSITMAKPASRTTPAVGSQSNSIAGSFKRMFGSSSAAPAPVISKPVSAPVPVSTAARDVQPEPAAAPAVSGKVQNLIKKFGGTT
jgi:hypothetical protein